MIAALVQRSVARELLLCVDLEHVHSIAQGYVPACGVEYKTERSDSQARYTILLFEYFQPRSDN